jgi:3',5'-cyclic AMP phosphodiesterase CpdA
MTFRIAQLSDAHLSARLPLFESNFDRVAQAVREAGCDLVVATGDLSLDGADHRADLEHARARHAAIGPELLAVPGNHDVGDDAALGGRQPADALRLARWREVFGAIGFVRDVPGWRLIGLDTQGLEAPGAEAHWTMLAGAIAGAGARRIALFQHKPLAQERLSDTAETYWCLRPAPRARLLALFGAARPALVACGHVHQYRVHAQDGVPQLWAPATGFIVGDRWQRPVGSKLLGWVEHLLHPDGTAEHRLRLVDGLALHDIGTIPQAYGVLAEEG